MFELFVALLILVLLLLVATHRAALAKALQSIAHHQPKSIWDDATDR